MKKLHLLMSLTLIIGLMIMNSCNNDNQKTIVKAKKIALEDFLKIPKKHRIKFRLTEIIFHIRHPMKNE